MPFGLSDTDVKKIKVTFELYKDVEKVILYGSRAKGNFKPSSDIDLTVFGNNLSLNIKQKIEIDLDDLMLPYKFDVSIYHQLTSVELIEHIQRVGITFYEKKIVI